MNPPQLATNLTVNHTYRFRSTNAAVQAITAQDLVFIAGAMCTTANTTMQNIAGSVKLRHVEIWSPPASQGAASTCSVEYVGNAGTSNREFSDSTVSTAVPAHLRCSPPPGSGAAFWAVPAADVLMNVTAPVGSIIDVSCTHVMRDDAVAGISYAIAAGTLGAVYYAPLDGVTDIFLPVSLSTTT